MRLGLGRKTRNVLAIFLLPIPISIMDWGHFFPISAQPDLLFQAIGEVLELTTLVGLTLLLSFVIVKAREDGKKAGGWVLCFLVIAASFSLILLTLSWRDFFPNDQLCLSAVHARRLAGVFLGGLIFASIGSMSER